MTPYEYYNNQIGVLAKWLYTSKLEGGSGLLTKTAYDKAISRRFLITLRRGCVGTPALVKFNEDMYNNLYERIIAIAGKPKENIAQNLLQDIIEIDHDATVFFNEFRKEDGSSISFELQQKYVYTASILNGVRMLIEDHLSKARALGQTKSRMWKNVAESVKSLTKFTPHFLPTSPRRLEEKYKEYNLGSYDGLLHGNFNNDNSALIKDAVADWWLASYSMPNKPKVAELMKQYNVVRQSNGWPAITEAAVLLWLNKPSNKRLWFISRHGKKEWNNKFGYKTARDKSRWFPNLSWAIDGSKADAMHYWDNQAKMASYLKANYLFDVYSEMIIGYDLAEAEDHVSHFKALKMGAAFAGKRPYQLTYDNQSGHKTMRMQTVYTQLVAKEGGCHFPTRPRRSSNPAEGLIGRFQQQFFNKLWFSDKQSIKAKSLDAQPNWDFIESNKHLLPKQDELIKAFEYCVYQWNHGKHPHFNKTRLEVYQEEMPQSEELDITEMVNIFWVEETQGNRYTGEGITMKLQGVPYTFEVFNEDGSIDLEFRRKYVQEKFIIRYDPELMSQGVQLWLRTETGIHYVATAEPKRAFDSIPFTQHPGEKAQWAEDFALTTSEPDEAFATIKEIQLRAGITPERLIQDQLLAIKMGGDAPKDIRSLAEAEESAFDKL